MRPAKAKSFIFPNFQTDSASGKSGTVLVRQPVYKGIAYTPSNLNPNLVSIIHKQLFNVFGWSAFCFD